MISKKTSDRIATIVGILFVLVMVSRTLIRKDVHNSFGYCTITKPGSGWSKSRQTYEYKAEGKFYEFSGRAGSGSHARLGEKYVMTYDSLDPKNIALYFGCRILLKNRLIV